jgi:ribonuclease-3
MKLPAFIGRLFKARSGAGADLEKVQKIIGYHFRSPHLLQLALTHRSVARNADPPEPSNERLEYLGDSVLGLVIAERLYEDYRRLSEGDLTQIRAKLVNEITLARIGKQLRLNRYILLSADESRSGGRQRSSIVSDAVESIIGGVFIDGGYAAARDVVLRLIYVHRDRIISDESQRNYKGELLELVQARGGGMPRYEVVAEEGPDHEKVFRVLVTINGHEAGEGRGQSKKEAEQRAASEALARELQDPGLAADPNCRS